MPKLRVELSKGEEIRYISHLDYAGAIEKAIRRASLPVAYSEGFNPHMKIAFASALAVGVTSETEYMDIEVTETIEIDQMLTQLAQKMPPGISIKQARYMPDRSPALMAVINLATYKIIVPMIEGSEQKKVYDCIKMFLQTEEYTFIKESPKGRREINIRQYLFGDIQTAFEENNLELTMAIRITPTGSVKPSDVLEALTNFFELPIKKDSALITRTGLFIQDSSIQRSPMQI